jgi:hypothetical protein
MTTEIEVKNWEECEAEILKIVKAHSTNLTGVWFRGQSDSEWRLDTTLERQTNRPDNPVAEYYRLIGVIKPTIETFTGSVWEIPTFDEVQEWASSYDFSLKLLVKDEIGYGFLAHLRHQGFPSPLLDWTGSQYVAAYFAFADAQKSDRVAIYVFIERPKNIKSGGSNRPAIYGFGPIVKTHPRHFRQQSQYTICAEYVHPAGWKFVPHQNVFNLKTPDQDLLWKIVIPASERVKVLGLLHKYNLNAFSLFDSEESLMKTLAVREIDLKS